MVFAYNNGMPKERDFVTDGFKLIEWQEMTRWTVNGCRARENAHFLYV